MYVLYSVMVKIPQEMLYVQLSQPTDKLKFSDAALRIPGDNVFTNDPYLVDVKSDIAEIQRRFLDKFDPSAEPPMTFRNRTQKGSLDDVNPSDLIDILEFGIEVGLSNSQGDKLIALIKRLFGRRKMNIQLRNEYESMKRSLSTNVTAPMHVSNTTVCLSATRRIFWRYGSCNRSGIESH